jgi:hypothetical protein
MKRSPALAGAALRVAAAACAGFAMVTTAAAVLQAEDRNAIGLKRLAAGYQMVLIYIFVLPFAGWILLRLLRLRPASVVAILGQILFVPVLIVLNRPGGLHYPPWGYGLEAAVAYGTAAVVVLSGSTLLGRWLRAGPDGGPPEDRTQAARGAGGR